MPPASAGGSFDFQSSPQPSRRWRGFSWSSGATSSANCRPPSRDLFHPPGHHHPIDAPITVGFSARVVSPTIGRPCCKRSAVSHLTTHHPVRNCKRSSDLPVRVPVAHAIRRFRDLFCPPGERLKMRIGSQSLRPRAPTETGKLIWSFSGYIRVHPANKKIKKFRTP